MKIAHVSDVHRLSRSVTPEMLDELFGDDYDTFDYMVAADALFPVPYAVTAWLRRDDNIIDWIGSLTVKTFDLQVYWWRQLHERGIHHPSTHAAKRRLGLMRERHREALALLAERNKPKRIPVPVSRALDRLEKQHAQEYERYIEEQRRIHGPLDNPPTRSPEAMRLLNMSQEEFDAVVSADVLDHTLDDGLAEFLVAARWRDTLIRLGDKTLARLGAPPSDARHSARFMVSDQHLPAEPTGSWVRPMAFLAHVQARLIECLDIRRRHKKTLSELLFIPAEERLRAAHYAEYVRYRLEEEAARAKGTDHIPPPYPRRFPELRERLTAAGWDVLFVRKGDVAWLEARRGGEWMTVKGKQHPKKSGGWKKNLGFYVCRTDFADLWYAVGEERWMAIAGSTPGLADLEPVPLSSKDRVWDLAEKQVAPVYVTGEPEMPSAFGSSLSPRSAYASSRDV